ncbi:TetR family transcriptional regulator [Leucobacter luti]|uniref:TetR family transcriptional regulator n=1 Tax=Leucobacter luti TaxID=340320 RepID=A0A4R6S1A6_9MICO|nr:TetR/AcrR family transcriptional regulator [Leucobacter luti]TDP92416.1 TetR family transcriptional regulator [Leucobacter luti]
MAKQDRAIATRESLVEAACQVFSRMHFESARVVDILEASSVTQGAFYFHFPQGKKQIAEEIISRQDSSFVALRDAVATSGLDGLSGLLRLTDVLGDLLSRDSGTQAGLRLVLQASTNFPEIAHLPDPRWLEAIAGFLHRADGEGNLRKGVDIPLAARTVVYLFTGAQVSSFVNDAWSELPKALRTIEPYVLSSLAVDGFVPQSV